MGSSVPASLVQNRVHCLSSYWTFWRTKMQLENLILRFGGATAPLATQLEEQGYHLPASLAHYQRAADSITWLLVHEYLTDRQAQRMRRKIHKRLSQILKKKAKVKR